MEHAARLPMSLQVAINSSKAALYKMKQPHLHCFIESKIKTIEHKAPSNWYSLLDLIAELPVVRSNISEEQSGFPTTN